MFLIGSCHAAQESITIGDWIFAADLGDEWRADSTPLVESFDDWEDCYEDEVFWSGTMSGKSYFIPKGPTEMHYSGLGGKSGFIDLEVFTIPEQFKGLKMTDLLKAVADNCHCYTADSGGEKKIEFDGREAHLWEEDAYLDGKDYSFGVIAIKLSDTEIGVIEIERWDDAGRAWDAIESFKITHV